MFQTSGYGQTYANIGGAQTGAQIYSAQRGSVTFARAVEIQRLALQKRQLDQQEARMEAARKDSERNYELAQSRFELERQRLDNDYAIRQQEREMAKLRYEQALAQQQEARERQQMLDDEASAQKWAALDMDQQRIDLQGERLRKADDDALRNERNRMSEAGGRLLSDGESPKDGEHLYEGADGKTRWAVPNKAAASGGTGSRGVSMYQLMKSVDEKIKGYKTEDDGQGQLKYLLDVVDPEGKNTELRGEVDRLVAEHTDKKGNVDYGTALSAVRSRMPANLQNPQAETARWNDRQDKSRKAVELLTDYRNIAMEKPDLVQAIPPSVISKVKWTRVSEDTYNLFKEYLANGNFTDERTNATMISLLVGSEQEARQADDKSRKKEAMETLREIGTSLKDNGGGHNEKARSATSSINAYTGTLLN